MMGIVGQTINVATTGTVGLFFQNEAQVDGTTLDATWETGWTVAVEIPTGASVQLLGVNGSMQVTDPNDVSDTASYRIIVNSTDTIWSYSVGGTGGGNVFVAKTVDVALTNVYAADLDIDFDRKMDGDGTYGTGDSASKEWRLRIYYKVL